MADCAGARWMCMVGIVTASSYSWRSPLVRQINAAFREIRASMFDENHGQCEYSVGQTSVRLHEVVIVAAPVAIPRSRAQIPPSGLLHQSQAVVSRIHGSHTSARASLVWLSSPPRARVEHRLLLTFVYSIRKDVCLSNLMGLI
jgi:hypothetical protein